MKTLYLSIGFISLSLGALGVVLPLLPTTPFMILSAFCFSRSSEKLHRWILQNPVCGPMLQDWERFGVIRKRAKITASLLLICVSSLSALYLESPFSLIALGLSVSSLLVFLWTRPSKVPGFEAEASRAYSYE